MLPQEITVVSGTRRHVLNSLAVPPLLIAEVLVAPLSNLHISIGIRRERHGPNV